MNRNTVGLPQARKMDQAWVAFAGIIVAPQAIAAFVVLLAAWFLRRDSCGIGFGALG